ncbi:hypothetical protein C8Q76DRAFT_697857 [Earliella scabrosa]|nr:hypothetical protein C8Q76DRAFT_697857 [Earliella scabrosa]
MYEARECFVPPLPADRLTLRRPTAHQIQPSEGQRTDARRRSSRSYICPRSGSVRVWQRASVRLSMRASNGLSTAPADWLLRRAAALPSGCIVLCLASGGQRSGPSSSPAASSGSDMVHSVGMHIGIDLSAVVARSDVPAVDLAHIAEEKSSLRLGMRPLMFAAPTGRPAAARRPAYMSLTASWSVSTSGVRWSSLFHARYPLLRCTIPTRVPHELLHLRARSPTLALLPDRAVPRHILQSHSVYPSSTPACLN